MPLSRTTALAAAFDSVIDHDNMAFGVHTEQCQATSLWLKVLVQLPGERTAAVVEHVAAHAAGGAPALSLTA